MTTWSCKAPAAALALGLLAGCDGGGGASFLDGLSTVSRGPDVALSQASMASGAVDLVAPRGFCIDKRTLKPQFALIARCDKLGVPSAAGNAPLGVITVSLAPSPAGTPLPSAEQITAALRLKQVGAPVEDDRSVIFRAAGKPTISGTGPVHWRGTTQIGGQLIGLALYGPEDGRAVGSEGQAVLSALIARTIAAQ